jgi:O-antigen/teichoic acid export membrane protein
VRVHETLQVVIQQLNSAFSPVLAHLAGAGNLERMNAVIRGLLPMVAALAAVGSVCIAVLNHTFVNLWVGPAAFGGQRLTVLMSVAMWISSVAYVAYEALLARGEFAFISRAFAIGSALHLLVLVTVLQVLGAWAAPLALCVSTLCWGALLWRRVAGDMQMERAQARRLFIEPLLIGATGCAAALALSALPRATSWAAFVGEAALVAVGVASLLLIVRPALRAALHSEIVSTLRALRST